MPRAHLFTLILFSLFASALLGSEQWIDNTGRLSVEPAHPAQTPAGNGMPFAMPVQQEPFSIPYERERRALAERYRMNRRMEDLRSVCLYSKDAKYKDKVPGDLGYLLSDRALSDRDGQDLLLGDEIAATVAGGDVYGAIESYIGTVPQERQAEYKEKLRGCKTEADGKRMLGGMFRERAEAEWKKEQIFLAYNSLLAGWPNDKQPWASREQAIKVLGEEWITEYEQTSPSKRDLMFRAHYSHTQGHPFDKTAYCIRHANDIQTLHSEVETQVEYLKNQDIKAERERAKELRKRIRRITASSACAILGTSLVVYLLKLGIKKELHTRAYKRFQTWQLHHWAILAICVLLIIAIIGGAYGFLWQTYKLPHGYYTLLRLTVTATAILLTYQVAKAEVHPLRIILWVSIALLYQPLIRVELEKEVWLVIDLVLMILLIIQIYTLPGKRE